MSLSTETKKLFRLRDFESIRSLFKRKGIEVFSDLDDTLTLSNAIYFSRFFLLTRILRKDPVRAARFLLKEYVVNPGFLEVAKKHDVKDLFILSRNDQRFVDVFISETKDIFASHWIRILGGLGSDKYLLKWRMFTEDKLQMVPEWALLISDLFEAGELSRYEKFVSIDEDVSSLALLSRSCMKLMRFGRFLISLAWISKSV